MAPRDLVLGRRHYRRPWHQGRGEARRASPPIPRPSRPTARLQRHRRADRDRQAPPAEGWLHRRSQRCRPTAIAAEALKGTELFVRPRAPAGAGERRGLFHDLVGLAVMQNGGSLGEVVACRITAPAISSTSKLTAGRNGAHSLRRWFVPEADSPAEDRGRSAGWLSG